MRGVGAVFCLVRMEAISDISNILQIISGGIYLIKYFSIFSRLVFYKFLEFFFKFLHAGIGIQPIGFQFLLIIFLYILLVKDIIFLPAQIYGAQTIIAISAVQEECAGEAVITALGI